MKGAERREGQGRARRPQSAAALGAFLASLFCGEEQPLCDDARNEPYAGYALSEGERVFVMMRGPLPPNLGEAVRANARAASLYWRGGLKAKQRRFIPAAVVSPPNFRTRAPRSFQLTSRR